MGNFTVDHTAKSVDHEAQEFVNFLERRNKSSGKPLRAKSSPKNPLGTEMVKSVETQAWRQLMITTLVEFKEKNKWRQAATALLESVEALQLDSFVRAVSMLFQLRNKEVMDLQSRHVMKEEDSMKHVPEVKQSKNVFVSFAGQLLHFSMILGTGKEEEPKVLGGALMDLLSKKNPKDKHDCVNAQPELNPTKQSRDKQRDELKRKRQMAMWILCEEFNQPYHPYNLIKQFYCKFLQQKYTKLFADSKPTWERVCRLMQNDLKLLCALLVDSSEIYRNWIVEYADVKQDKLDTFLGKAVLNSLFSGQSNLHPFIISAIHSVNREKAKAISTTIRDNVSVEKFFISRKLQIEGNYIQSLLMLADMDRVTNPRSLLRFLERLKDQICNDIDFYHKLFETGQQFTVDGDNLLGILCFLVCRMKAKLPELQSQIMFLRVAYGDEVTMLYDAASYMVTAFMAAFQFIESEEFKKTMEVS